MYDYKLSKPTAFLVIISCLFHTAFTGSAPNVIKQFDQIAEEAIQHYDIPGAALAVVTAEKTLLLKTWGVRKLGNKEKIDSDTIFRLASLSKPLTAALTIKLSQQGLLNLDDPITCYLPNLIIRDKACTQKIKIRHLLSHSTGIQRYCLEKQAFQRQPFDKLIKNLYLAKKISNPGQCFQYQNVIFSLMGPIIQQATHQSFLEVIQKELLQPLQMRNTLLTEIAYMHHDNIAFPHIKKEGSLPYHPFQSKSYYYNILPAGGIAASITDMTKWLQALLGGKQKILNKTALSMLYTPFTTIQYGEQYYGLGCYIKNYLGHQVVYHTGILDGFSTLIAFSPKHKIGIVIFTNADRSSFPRFLMYQFFDLVFGLTPERL